MQQRGIVDELNRLCQKQFCFLRNRKVVGHHADQFCAEAFAARKKIVIKLVQLWQIGWKVLGIIDFEISDGALQK
ncbi:hypothetical protein D3C87_1859020 [compost metagenome]